MTVHLRSDAGIHSGSAPLALWLAPGMGMCLVLDHFPVRFRQWTVEMSKVRRYAPLTSIKGDWCSRFRSSSVMPMLSVTTVASVFIVNKGSKHSGKQQSWEGTHHELHGLSF